jgi:hypothetical protein
MAGYRIASKTGYAPQKFSSRTVANNLDRQSNSTSPRVLNNPVQTESENKVVTPEQAAASQIVSQYTGIPAEVIKAKNSGYNQSPLNHATDAIWDRVRKAGLSSPEQAIRSGLFTPAEVRYITENDLWRYR